MKNLTNRALMALILAMLMVTYGQQPLFAQQQTQTIGNQSSSAEHNTVDEQFDRHMAELKALPQDRLDANLRQALEQFRGAQNLPPGSAAYDNARLGLMQVLLAEMQGSRRGDNVFFRRCLEVYNAMMARPFNAGNYDTAHAALLQSLVQTPVPAPPPVDTSSATVAPSPQLVQSPAPASQPQSTTVPQEVVISTPAAQQSVVVSEPYPGYDPNIWDYEDVQPNGKVHVRIMKDKATIDEMLRRAVTLSPDSEYARMNALPWKQLSKFRLDPVTVKGGPIRSMPPTPMQMQEITGAVEVMLSDLPAEARTELLDAIRNNRGKLGPLQTRYYEKMINGHKAVDKFMISETLAQQTRSFEVFLKTIGRVYTLVLICGNIAIPFQGTSFVTTPPPPPPVALPPQATCELLVDGVKTGGVTPVRLYPDQSTKLTCRAVGDISQLQMKQTWSLPNPKTGQTEVFTNPTFLGEDTVTYGPLATLGRYSGNCTLSDKYGRQNVCPVQLESVRKPEAPPPPGKVEIPPKPECGKCPNDKLSFRVSKSGTITINVSDFLKGIQIKPESIQWFTGDNPAGDIGPLTISGDLLKKQKEVQIKLKALDINGCEIICYGVLRSKGGKWWILIVGIGVVAGVAIGVSHHAQQQPVPPPPGVKPPDSGGPRPNFAISIR